MANKNSAGCNFPGPPVEESGPGSASSNGAPETCNFPSAPAETPLTTGVSSPKSAPVAKAKGDAAPAKNNAAATLYKDELLYSKWMQRLGFWAAGGAVVATAALVVATVIAAAPYIATVACVAAAGLGAFAVASRLTRNFSVSATAHAALPARVKGEAARAKRKAIDKLDSEEMNFDKLMHGLGVGAWWTAVAATGALTVAFAVAAAPVVLPVAAPVAAGMGAFALGSKLTRHFMVSGSRPHFEFPQGYFSKSGWTHRLNWTKR